MLVNHSPRLVKLEISLQNARLEFYVPALHDQSQSIVFFTFNIPLGIISFIGTDWVNLIALLCRFYKLCSLVAVR